MVLPFFYFQSKLGPSFQGVLPEIVNDELFYYARIKDVVDDHSLLGNAYLAEHKSALPQQVFLAEYLLAQPIKLFNLNINTAHLIYNFLFPAVVLILAYLALYLISKSRFWAIIFSLFLFFGLYLIDFIRPISPQFNFIFWLTQFIFLWLLISQRGSTKYLYAILVLNILNFGLLFYIYAYYWTFYLIFFLIFIAFDFASFKYFHNSNYGSKQIIKIIVGGLILAIPYFYINYLSSQLPYYTETLTRLGMIYTRFPSGFRIIFWSAIGLAAFCWFLWKKIINLDIKSLFFISGILASVIAVNQHLITGKNFEFSSHYSMGAMFFLVFAAAYLWQKLRERQNNLKLLSASLTVVFIFIIFLGAFSYLKVFALNEESIYIQNYAAVFEWLNKNTPKDSVVYTNPDLSGLIPVYTANNVYYAREANLFFISDNEVLDRFVLNNFFEDFNKDFIIENVRSIYGVRFIDVYGHTVQGNKLRRLLGVKPEQEIYLPEEAIEKVISRAKELQSGDFIKELKQFRIDYLIWDKNKNPGWKIDPNFFSEIYSKNNTIIYQSK